MRSLLYLCFSLCLLGIYLATRADDAQLIAAEIAKSAHAAGPKKTTPQAYRKHSIARHRDGHFYINAKVEGRPLVFLVDTGASTILLSPADAARLGHMPPKQAFKHEFHTANGITYAARTKLDQIRIGGKDFAKVEAYIIPEGLSVSLLGQSVLRKFTTVQMRRDTLELSW